MKQGGLRIKDRVIMTLSGVCVRIYHERSVVVGSWLSAPSEGDWRINHFEFGLIGVIEFSQTWIGFDVLSGR